MRLAILFAIAGCTPPLPPEPPHLVTPEPPACTPASLDRMWDHRAGHPNLVVADGAIHEYLDDTIFSRSLATDAQTAIPSGFAYGMDVVVGGGYVYWLKSVRESNDRHHDTIAVQIWTAAEHGGAPTAIPGELATPVELHAAPDGVFAVTSDALLHIDRAGARRVELAASVQALAITGDSMYLASEAAILRRKLAGGELELVARLRDRFQVRAIAALGDRAVWFETSHVVSANHPGSTVPVALGTFSSDKSVATSASELYVAAGNVVYVVTDHNLRPVAKARADIRAFGVDGAAIYALVEDTGLTRLCHQPSVAIRVRVPSPALDCPPYHTEQWAPGLRHLCVDAAGEMTFFHRDWYQSGDLQEERSPDGTFVRRWADGNPIVEGHYDDQGLEDGEWLEYTDDGLQVTHYANGHKLP